MSVSPLPCPDEGEVILSQVSVEVAVQEPFPTPVTIAEPAPPAAENVAVSGCKLIAARSGPAKTRNKELSSARWEATCFNRVYLQVIDAPSGQSIQFFGGLSQTG